MFSHICPAFLDGFRPNLVSHLSPGETCVLLSEIFGTVTTAGEDDCGDLVVCHVGYTLVLSAKHDFTPTTHARRFIIRKSKPRKISNFPGFWRYLLNLRMSGHRFSANLLELSRAMRGAAEQCVFNINTTCIYKYTVTQKKVAHHTLLNIFTQG